MKVTVEIAFAGGVGAAGLVLDDPTRGLLDSGILDGPFPPIDAAQWVDVSEDVDNRSGISLERGRTSEVEDYETATGSLSLNNPDRKYDPTNEDSPYFPNVLPLRRARIFAQPNDGGPRIPVWLGFIDDFTVAWNDVNESRVSASLDGPFTLVAGAELEEIDPDFAGEDSGARLRRVLALPEVDYPYEVQVDDGLTILGDTTFGENALTYLRKIAKSEQGFLYEGRGGEFIFRNRHAPLSVAPAVVFSDDPDAFAGIHYAEASLNRMTELLFTDILARGVSEVPQRFRNDDAFKEYGARTLDLGPLLTESDDDVADLLGYLSFLYSEPFTFISEITVQVHSLEPAHQRQLLELDIADRVTVRRLPPGSGDPIVEDLLVDGVVHSITSMGWELRLRLATLDARAFLRLDDTVLGKLDENVLAF